MQRLLFIFPALLFFLTSFAQKRNIKFEIIGTEAGLSQSNVICIHQDSRGFMWFGTRDGLNKYDGYEITIFKNEFHNTTSISNNTINDIAEDAQGNLWIATGNGLNKFDRSKERFTRFYHDPSNPESIGSNIVNCLAFDSAGVLWIGYEGAGFDRFNITTQEIRHFRHKQNENSLAHDIVKKITIDSQGNFWIATDARGLSVYSPNVDRFQNYHHDPTNQKSLSHDRISEIFVDSDDRIWVGTMGGGLNLFEKETQTFERFNTCEDATCRPQYVLAIHEDARHNLWLGTENGGLWILEPESKTMQSYIAEFTNTANLNNNSIWSICRDTKGNMWVGTFSGGVNFFSRDTDKFIHYQKNASAESLSNNNVLAIIEDSNKNIWIGTDGGGLNLFDKRTGDFVHYIHNPDDKNSLAGDYVLSVLEANDGNLWVGTWGQGLSIFSPKTKTFRTFQNDPKDPTSLASNNVWALLQDSKGDIWIGTYFGGLDRYDQKTNTFIHYHSKQVNDRSISQSMVNEIFEDSKQNIWVGTNGGGLNLVDKKKGMYKAYTFNERSNSLSNNVVYCITEDSKGALWIGTAYGLNHFDPVSERFTNYYRKDGLPNESIFGILEDHKGNIWVSTNKGLSKFDPVRNHFTNYTVADGLQSEEFKQGHCLASDGKMYFGGIKGFNEFHPDSIEALQFDPPLVLTSLQISNQKVAIDSLIGNHTLLSKHISEIKEITFFPEHSVFSFEFATLNYTARDRKQYAYMLENFDTHWNYIGTNRSATYTNLNPGHYVFHVKGLDNSGNWSGKTISLNVTILPPFWKTWWFKSLIGLLSLSLIFLIYKIRVASIQQKKQELERLVEERTERLNISTNEERKAREEADRARQEAEHANKAKSIFLATMSHEIRTPMNGVIGMASLLSQTQLDEEQRDYVNTIKSSGESLLTVINDILDFSKIESGKMDIELKDFDLRHCIEEVFDLFSNKAAELGLDLLYQIDYNVPSQIISDPLRLRQILINLVGNAIKFTKHGEIFVGVHLKNQNGTHAELEFKVRDTGIGIPKDKQEKLFKAFSQVDSSTTRKYGGTGLGLAISQKLVALLGGIIQVESEEGKGTVFTFSVNAEVSIRPIKTYVHNSMNGLEGKSVLVVDDNATNRIILKNQLESWKLNPVLAASVNEALQLSSQHSFDLVITDMEMPEGNGVELASALKKDHPSIPIILLTSHSDGKAAGHDSLFSSMLTKPVKQNLLSAHVLKELKQQHVLKSINHHPQNGNHHALENFGKSYPLEILVVEDNPINQKLTGRILTKMGYNPDMADNGHLALEKLSLKKYPLILMDIQMPELDGIETTRIIRSTLSHQPVIVAMTANALESDKEMCLSNGMNDYISKPIQLDVMVALIQKWVEIIKNRTE